MPILRSRFAVLLLVVSTLAAFPLLGAGDPADAPGSSDPAPFGRMPGFTIYSHDAKEFDRLAFPVSAGKEQAVEGRLTSVTYYVKEGVARPSALQIVRNYVNAAEKAGGKTVYRFEDGGAEYATLKVVTGDAEVWALVEAASNGIYSVKTVAKALMRQDVVADAASLARTLGETGRVVVHGIFFDTGRSEVKPESEPTLVQIGKLLKSDPKLKLYVVGHTDSAGAFDANVKLSQARAAAVVAALVGRHGVAAARLTPFGAGPAAPAASNRSDAGRAKNRRVELVEQ